ncbi:type II secretion system secretin GspD [Luteimonas vadosa]
MRPTLTPAVAACLAVLLAACTTMPAPTVRREGTMPRIQRPAAEEARTVGGVVAEPLDSAGEGGPRAQVRRGTGVAINQGIASAPPPNFAGSSGAASFNFEGESLHAVVKAILGDMLGQNFTIAPNVSGTVTLNVQRVSPAQAFTLLEQVLGWNNARMVYTNGVYNIVPADQALAGTVAPRTGSAATARGFETRVVPLRYISATEMEKVLKPYARPNAIVGVDGGRNVITVGGTRAELENYLRTIAIFDVDWLAGMSVGVYPLQSGRAAKVVGDLEKVFGAQSNSPVAGMFRFLPLEGANAVMVITSQPNYLDEIQQWIDRIDGAGAGVRLYSYELKYITAKDLAERLAEVYGGGGGRSNDGGGSATLMPGLESTTIQDGGIGDRGVSSAQIGGSGGDPGGGSSGLGGGSLSLGERAGGNAAVTLEVDGERVGVSAVDETNTLLVRTSASAWRAIKDVIERLDVMPLQVHIEAQVAEVTLSGDLQYGVSWYFENVLGITPLPDNAGVRNLTGTGGLTYSFLTGSSVGILSALDQVSDVQMLQTPSVMVRNNYEATLNVGSRIPISSVTVNPGLGTDTISQVQYLDTGTILKVRPRVTKDGTVFLDLVQEVSSPAGNPDQNGNVRIDTRRLKTNAIVQSGETVIMAGLIQDGITRGSNGLPGLSRIPVIGGLFGQQRSVTTRSEVIILLTPTLVRDPSAARDLTDEYGRRFRALEPLYRTPR